MALYFSVKAKVRRAPAGEHRQPERPRGAVGRRLQQRRPDIARARDLLGWEPKVELIDGLRKTIERAGIERLVGATD
jgi:nucleoside-diphosphate-sugar epimerase